MATPFNEIYGRAIFRFTEHKFLKQDIQAREDVLENYLVSAKTDFLRICKIDLSDCDFEQKQFNDDLDDEDDDNDFARADLDDDGVFFDDELDGEFSDEEFDDFEDDEDFKFQ